MTHWKNVSQREVTLLHGGRKIRIAPGQVVEGPGVFGMYKALKEVNETEVDRYKNAANKVIKYNTPQRAKQLISADEFRRLSAGKKSHESISLANNFPILENNIKEAGDAIKFITQLDKQRKPTVAICVEGSESQVGFISERLKSTVTQVYTLYRVTSENSSFETVKPEDIKSLKHDYIVTHKGDVSISNDYILPIIQYGCINKVNIPRPFHIQAANRDAVKKEIIQKYKSIKTAYMSVVTLTHNESQYKDLLASLKMQRTDKKFEIIAIPNFNKTFKSCAEALNIGIELSDGLVVNMCHQDLKIPNDWIANITHHTTELDKNRTKWGVIGMAGASKSVGISNPNRDYTAIYLSDKINGRSLASIFRQVFGRRKEVQCVDELCLIMKKDRPFRFDEELCNHYHWYGADICLEALSKGYRNFAIDAECYHLSNGQDNLKNGHAQLYAENATRLFRKWRDRFSYWRSTTGIFMVPEKTFVPIIFHLINQSEGRKLLPEAFKIDD